MKLCCIIACCASVVSAGGGNALRRQVASHLRADDAPLAAIAESQFRTSLALFVGQQPDSFSSSDHRLEGDETGAAPQKSKQPTHMQVPEEEMKEFMGKLSTGCEKQYKDILNGDGAAMHTFGSPQVKASEAECQKLVGKLCFTRAMVQQQKLHTERDMKSMMDVTGNSCLPDQCVEKGDLTALAEFMRQKAKEQMPGMDAKIGLHVDCSQSGGAMVDIGDGTDAVSIAKGMNSTSGKTGTNSSNPFSAAAPSHSHSGAISRYSMAIAALCPVFAFRSYLH